jgi:hypothetical protein
VALADHLEPRMAGPAGIENVLVPVGGHRERDRIARSADASGATTS